MVNPTCSDCGNSAVPTFARFCPACSETVSVRKADRCPSCEESFGQAFPFCPGCGAGRTDPSTEIPPDLTDSCPHCGRPTHSTLDFCPTCGKARGELRERCPDCDRAVDQAWLYCIRCGSRVEHLFNLQERGFSCGAAAMRNALAMLGIAVPEPELRQLTGARPFHGTDDEGFARAAIELGIQHEHVSDGDLARLRAEVAAGNPCVVDWRHGQHYVCVVGATEQRVIFVDSNPRDAGMVRFLAPERFLQLWWDSDDAATRKHAMHIFRLPRAQGQAASKPA